MQKNNTVLKFPHGGASFDKKNLSESLQSLPWRLRAQSLLDLMGYHESDSLDGNACCAKNSHAGQLGVKTLGELCEYLDLSEEEIVGELSALHLSSKKSISGDTPSDILANYKQIVSVLGRDPINSSEVMDAISYVKDSKITNLTSKNDELKAEIGFKDRRIGDLEVSLKGKEKEVEEARRELSLKVKDLEESITGLKYGHQREIKNLEERHREEIAATSEAVRSRMSVEFESRLEEVKVAHQVEIHQVKVDHQQAISQLEKIIEHEMVSIQEFDRANLENEQLRDINRDNLTKIKELAGKLEMLGDENFNEMEVELKDLREKMAKLENAYLVTQEACVKYKAYTAQLKEKLAREAEKKIEKIQAKKAPKATKRATKLQEEEVGASDSSGDGSFYAIGVSVVATAAMVLGYMLLAA